MREHERILLVLLFAGILVVIVALCAFRSRLLFSEKPHGTYDSLPADMSTGDPIAYLDPETFAVKEGFTTNLPIVILSLDSELPDYKDFADSQEVLLSEEPYTTGNIRIIDTGTGTNAVTDPVVYESLMKIKMRGHSSYFYYKKQYKFKSLLPDGESNNTDILGMGEGSEWILNGSLADKSMIRNYLAYRISSEIGGNNMAPDSRFCEVMMEQDGELIYQGVYLLMETITQGKDRVNIDKYNPKNDYSSYIVRRDRRTSFDIMLNTYGREAGLAPARESEEGDGWIGLKYPSASKVTPETVEYITEDFSRVEKVLYSEDFSVYRTYDRFIDVDSFVDYFLINELFGNYDAGIHSTFMYKNSGDVLHIGPVWDYDQALDNSQVEELDVDKLAFQTQPFFKELCEDKEFVRKLINRYNDLRESYLSEEHLYGVIDETCNYLNSAQKREYFRWADAYNVESGETYRSYILQPYTDQGYLMNRYTEIFGQNIVVIKYYLHRHADAIPEELQGVLRTADWDTSGTGIRELLFIGFLILLLLPSVVIMRRG